MVDNSYREILRIAIPSIISNITIPLLGLVGVAIVGHLGETAYIGSIAVAGILFNMVYWLFGFLRMGTSGLTAQAFGRKSTDECREILLRSLFIGIGAGILLCLLQTLVLRIALYFIEASSDVEHYASLYFRICIWGAPATLGLYSLNGWFIGMQNTRYPMLISIVQNLVNIGCSLFFVFAWEMKVEGVAWGALLSQYTGFILAFVAAKRILPLKFKHHYAHVFKRQSMWHFFAVNRDIFFRTLCIIAVTVYFTSAGALYGDTILAVNTLLMQLFTLYSYIMDGFAYAGEALVGKYYGANDNNRLHTVIRKLFVFAGLVCLFFTLLYGLGGQEFLSLLTDDRTVITASSAYVPWALAIPLAGMSAFIFDGISVGITATRQMFISMLISTGAFFLLYFSLRNMWGNHALWFAFIAYLTVRGLVLGRLLHKHIAQS